LGLNLLNDLASTGSIAARHEAQKAQLDEKFRVYRQQLQALANDKSRSAADRAQAQTALEQLPGIQKAELARELAGQFTPKLTADVINNQGNRLSGAGLAARVEAGALAHQERDDEKQLKAITELLKNGQTQQNEALTKIATILAQILGQAPPSIFQ
jgi:hypothetical protein